MRRFLSGIVGALVAALLQEYRRVTIDWLKIRATIWYVKGVARARRIAVRVVAIVAALLLGTAGFIVFHVGLFLWLPVSLAVKGMLLAALGLIYLISAGLVIRSLLSQGTWLRESGAHDLIAQAMGRGEREE
jgi:hypothetical protein